MSAAPHAIRSAAAGGTSADCRVHLDLVDEPMEPPAEIEQNSKTPSNAGLSDIGTRTREVCKGRRGQEDWRRTSSPIVCQLFSSFGGHSVQKVDVFVCVEGGHLFRRATGGTLQTWLELDRLVCTAQYQNVHFVQHIVGRDNFMCNLHSMRLHEMSSSICIRSNVA